MQPGGQYSTRITPEFLASFEGLPDAQPFAQILLYDFTTSQHALQQNHHDGLVNHFCNYLGPNMAIWVIGFASRAGTDRENQHLSDMRARAVVNRIAFQSGFRGSVGTMALGERRSQSVPEENSAYRRAVLVLAYRRPPFQEPPRPERTLTAFNHFRIRQSFGVQMGAAVAGCDYHFVIDYDLRMPGHPESAPCEYAFLGLGTGASVNIPGATQVAGNANLNAPEIWNYFSVPQAKTPLDFGGLARMTSLSVNALSFAMGPTYFTLMPVNSEAIPIENFEGPESIGMGGSVLIGSFIPTFLLD